MREQFQTLAIRDNLDLELCDNPNDIYESGMTQTAWEFYQAAYQAATKEAEKLRKAAEHILHLHLCEQEGISSGQPTREQWLKAVDNLSEALNK